MEFSIDDNNLHEIKNYENYENNCGVNIIIISYN